MLDTRLPFSCTVSFLLLDSVTLLFFSSCIFFIAWQNLNQMKWCVQVQTANKAPLFSGDPLLPQPRLFCASQLLLFYYWAACPKQPNAKSRTKMWVQNWFCATGSGFLNFSKRHVIKPGTHTMRINQSLDVSLVAVQVLPTCSGWHEVVQYFLWSLVDHPWGFLVPETGALHRWECIRFPAQQKRRAWNKPALCQEGIHLVKNTI